MLGYSKTAPNSPKCFINSVSVPINQWMDSASTSGEVYDVHTVKPYSPVCPMKIARTHEISLMQVIRGLGWQSWIRRSFRFITTSASMSKIVTAQNTVDRSQWRQRTRPVFFKLPQDSLSATKQPLIVQTEASQLNSFFDILSSPLWACMRSPGKILKPIMGTRFVTIQPFIKPWPCSTKWNTNIFRAFSF